MRRSTEYSVTLPWLELGSAQLPGSKLPRRQAADPTADPGYRPRARTNPKSGKTARIRPRARTESQRELKSGARSSTCPFATLPIPR
eukprot:1373100-Alexandrium_andersonii.AAC.1